MSKELETTFYRFLSEVRSFLSKLMKEPIKTDTSKYLKDRNFNKTKMINVLLKKEVLERHEKILDSTNSDEKKAKYVVSYKVKKKDFENRIHKIYIQYFEKNEPEKEKLNEEGEGGDAGLGGTSSFSVGDSTSRGDVGYDAPFGKVQRRSIYSPKESVSEGKRIRKIYVTEEQYRKLLGEDGGGATSTTSVANTSDGQIGPARPGGMTFRKKNGKLDNSAFERKPGFSMERLK